MFTCTSKAYSAAFEMLSGANDSDQAVTLMVAKVTTDTMDGNL